MDPRSGAAEIVRWRDAGAPCASTASVGDEEQGDTEVLFRFLPKKALISLKFVRL
jgi:hypothetical protein